MSRIRAGAAGFLVAVAEDDDEEEVGEDDTPPSPPPSRATPPGPTTTMSPSSSSSSLLPLSSSLPPASLARVAEEEGCRHVATGLLRGQAATKVATVARFCYNPHSPYAS
jgi:hypothetical protein